MESPSGHSSFNISKDLCRFAWVQRMEQWGEESRHIFDNIFKAAFHWKDSDFFEYAASLIGRHPSTKFFQWARARVATGDVPFKCFKKGLVNAVMAIPIRHVQRQSIVSFVPPSAPISDDVRNWLHMVYHELSTSAICFSYNLTQYNGHQLLDLISEYRDFDYLATRSAPLVESKLQEFPFVLGFMTGLFQNATVGTFPEESWDMYTHLAAKFIEAFDISALKGDGPDFEVLMRQLSYSSRQYKQDSKRSVHSLLVDFVGGLVHVDPGGSLLTELSSKFTAGCADIKPPQFDRLWLPFLHGLVSLMDSLRATSIEPQIRRIFTAILSAYINIYIGREPVKDTSLVRQPVKCDCHDCQMLNHFLRDPVRSVLELSADSQRMRHLRLKTHGHSPGLRVDTSFMGPSKLIFTKTLIDHEPAHRDWMSRKDQAIRRIVEFDSETLTLMLGENHTRKIAEMLFALRSTTSSYQPAGPPRSRTPVEKGAKQERRPDPIPRSSGSEPGAGMIRGPEDAIMRGGILREAEANQQPPLSLGLGPGAGTKRGAQDDAMSSGAVRKTGGCLLPGRLDSISETHTREVEPDAVDLTGAD